MTDAIETALTKITTSLNGGQHIAVSVPDVADLSLRVPILQPIAVVVAVVIDEAKALTIESADTYTRGIKIVKELKAAGKDIKGECAPMRRTFKALNGAAIAYESQYLDPIKTEIDRLERDLAQYQRKTAEQTAIEAARLTAERQQQATVAREQTAARLEEEGHGDLAAAVRETPVTAPDVQLRNTAAPKIAGAYVQANWKARYACQHPIGSDFPCCVENDAKVPRRYLMVDESHLNKKAKADHDTDPVEGIEFYDAAKMVVRE